MQQVPTKSPLDHLTDAELAARIKAVNARIITITDNPMLETIGIELGRDGESNATEGALGDQIIHGEEGEDAKLRALLQELNEELARRHTAAA